jgi:hypothetical protein
LCLTSAGRFVPFTESFLVSVTSSAATSAFCSLELIVVLSVGVVDFVQAKKNINEGVACKLIDVEREGYLARAASLL